MITYKVYPTYISVILDGNKVGEIRKVSGRGYQYAPTGGKGGDYFETLQLVKKSIKEE